MKIAMVDPSLFTGRYDDALCGALAPLGHRVTLLGRPMRDTDAIAPRGYRYEPRFFRFSEQLRGLTGEGKLFRAAKAAGYLADALVGPMRQLRRSDMVHVQWLPFAPADAHMLRRLRAHVPLVHTVHNSSAYHGDGGASAIQGRGYAGLLAQFDGLIVHGAPTRDVLVAGGVPADRISVISHPPMRLAVASAETLAGVPDPVMPRILFFGIVRPYKGLDLLVDACLSLWRAGHRFELAIAGKPFMDVAPMLDAIRDAGFGDMLLTDFGFLKEQRLDAHLRKADILAFPYRHIDSSGAFLSALHYGKPMVCAATGMFATLPPDAVSLVPVDDSAALATALLPLVDSAAIRRAAGERVLALGERFGNWKDAAVLTMEAYDRARAHAAARGVILSAQDFRAEQG
ncbi:glycosyltransferase family 4 protein [Sphingobium aquiterrae]|uniref:glycosyltransferase family 4 protein n=1 Tax=Sphingobium aquiterrae TaxID=2038656 RepID=UPI003019C6C4